MSSENNDWKKVETKFDTHDFSTDPILEGLLVEKRADVGENNSMLYVVQIKGQEDPVSFWGSTILDDLMRRIPEGCEIKVEYKGVVKNKTNNRETKQFDVYSREVPMQKVEDIKF